MNLNRGLDKMSKWLGWYWLYMWEKVLFFFFFINLFYIIFVFVLFEEFKKVGKMGVKIEWEVLLALIHCRIYTRPYQLKF